MEYNIITNLAADRVTGQAMKRNLKSLIVGMSLLVAVGASHLSTRADETKSVSPHSCCRAANPGALVLPSEQFFGQVAVSYAAAKEIPDTCCKLFCYCGCDQTQGHTSLLECFTSDYCGECPICQDEAIQALRLKKEGKSLAQIERWIDEHFQKGYDEMFKAPSKELQEYWRKRLWKPEKVTGTIQSPGDKIGVETQLRVN